MRVTSLELTKNKIEDVDGVHGMVLVLPFSFSSSFSIFLQSFLSLVLGFILVLGV
jgi:hypothetical protein